MDFGFQIQSAHSGQQAQVRLIADVAELQKDQEGHIGVAIGGGAPHCPCLYVVQVFEGSPVDKDGIVKPGDEILAVNSVGVKGQDKSMVAALIRQSPSPIRLSFNKLQFDVGEQSQTLEIALKKFKHWFVESMDPKTADALGLSRAILCNDLMTKLMDKLEGNSHYGSGCVWKHICEIASRETSLAEQELFKALGDCHKSFKKEQSRLVAKMDELIEQLKQLCHQSYSRHPGFYTQIFGR
uniref:PDZ domain-containing protein n=1 Tax=Ditylenchus dipsaci TaxID=166011 RepID=A0A915DMK8_9BILA